MLCNCIMAGTSACQNCPTKQWADEGRFPSRVFFAYGVDAVEVVRCVDCKYASFDRYVDGNVPVWDCTYWDSQTESNAYCSYGERITDA